MDTALDIGVLYNAILQPGGLHRVQRDLSSAPTVPPPASVLESERLAVFLLSSLRNRVTAAAPSAPTVRCAS